MDKKFAEFIKNDLEFKLTGDGKVVVDDVFAGAFGSSSAPIKAFIEAVQEGLFDLGEFHSSYRYGNKIYMFGGDDLLAHLKMVREDDRVDYMLEFAIGDEIDLGGFPVTIASLRMKLIVFVRRLM